MLTGTDRQTDRRTGGQTDRHDHVLSQADALTKNKIIEFLTFIIGPYLEMLQILLIPCNQEYLTPSS